MIQWGERPGTIRSTSNPESLTVGYILNGVQLEATAMALALGLSSALYLNLYRTNVALTNMGPLLWHVEVSYGPYEKKEPEIGDFKWNFQTGGGSRHITQSISTTNRYVKAAGVKVDHKGTIGLNENADVEGVDIPEAAFEWTEDRKLLLASYGWTYAQTVGNLTYTVNDASFRGLPTGSVLFKGASGSQSAKDPLLLELTYTFAYTPNITNKTVGDITGIAKKGWEYLWVEYKTANGAAGDPKLPKRPSQVNVEKVYESGDFSLLGIGTT